MIEMSISQAKSTSQDIAPVALAANGKVLSTATNRLGYLTPTDPSAGIETIRHLYGMQGYVWLKGLLPRSSVIDFAAGCFRIWRIPGWSCLGSIPRSA